MGNTDDQPQPGVARNPDPAHDRDRVVAAEARHIDVGIGHEGGAVALVAEPPHRTGVGKLEGPAADERVAIGEVGDRVEAGDRDPAVAVDHDILGGGGTDWNRGEPGGPRRACSAAPTAV